jgi:preprotein translocase subunit SecA
VCKDRRVEDEGGVHVLLTFFSMEVSEEIQLFGRTARQGDPGSISMVLLLDDLSLFDTY